LSKALKNSRKPEINQKLDNRAEPTETVLTEEQLVRQAIDVLIDKPDLVEATVF